MNNQNEPQCIHLSRISLISTLTLCSHMAAIELPACYSTVCPISHCDGNHVWAKFCSSELPLHLLPPQRETALPKNRAPQPVLVSDSNSDAPSDLSLEGVDPPASPAVPDANSFDTDHVPTTPVTPASHPAVARPLLGTPGFYPLGDSPATQLLTSLDLQLLHTPCDNLLHEEVNIPSSHMSAHTPRILDYDSDASTISAGHSSVSSASSSSTGASAPRKRRRLLIK